MRAKTVDFGWRPVRAAVAFAAGLLLWLPSVSEGAAGGGPPAEVAGGVPEIPERLVRLAAPWQQIRSARLADWLADGGGLLIVTRFGETDQVHRLTAAGGERRQLSFGAEPVAGAWSRPGDPSGIVVRADRGGGEAYQLYWLSAGDHEPRLLTDGVAVNGPPVWERSGRRYAFYSTRRNGRDWDVWIGEVTGGRPPVLAHGPGGTWLPAAWSPDGRLLLLLRYVSEGESDYHLLDVESGTVRPVTGPAGQESMRDGAWGDDGIYLTSDRGDGTRRLYRAAAGGGGFELLTPGRTWDVSGVTVAPAGPGFAYTVSEDGASALHAVPDGRVSRRLPLPPGVVSDLRFSPDGGRLAFTFQTPTRTPDVWVWHAVDGRLEQWTRSETGGLDPARFSGPELIRYPTFDTEAGRPRAIPAWYFRPADRPGPYPVLVALHGGPAAQFDASFSAGLQFYVAGLGLAVVAPNVRGSTGYGREFEQLDNGYRREDAVADVGALLDWIAGRPELDAGRVCVTGGSYGGYLALAALIRFGDRLRCGIDRVGISHFVTFLEGTAGWRRDLRRVEYGDERDPAMRAFLHRISPLTGAAAIRRPLLVVQGANDPRVPSSEARQIVRAVRANGAPVWYLEAADEGHGFRKRSNVDAYRHASALFLETFLLEGR